MDNSIQIDLIKKSINKNRKQKEEKKEEEKKEEENIKKYKTITKKNDFFFMNEMNVCEILKNISYYENYFLLLKEFNTIKIANIDKHILINEKYEKDKKTQNFILCKYKNINLINFTVFIYNLPTPKLFIFHLLDSYKYLLNTLIMVNEKNICFFHLSAKNIFFTDHYKPIIKNFENSIILDNLKNDYFIKIIENSEDVTNKPLEVFLLNYLIRFDEESLSESLIDIICEKYIKNLKFLEFFSKDYNKKYKNECIKTLKKYINKPKEIIMNDILKYINTWDNYSISILYLDIVIIMIKTFSLKGTFINKFVTILLKNILPEPSKRESLHNTQILNKKLYDEFSNWDFVNNISF